MTVLSYTLRDARPIKGYGLLYAVRTARAWWYSAWLRTLARFSRTYLGSFWLGLSNLLSVALLGVVYGAVFKVPDPLHYVVYLGIGLTIWGLFSQAVVSGCGLFAFRRDQIINTAQPALFYCLEEWAFQIQTFVQAFLIILVAASFLQPTIWIHSLTSIWLPLINGFVFSLWLVIAMAILGARYKDVTQLVPIAMQLLFLISPILYKKDALGSVAAIALLNPFYRFLAPIREAAIHGKVDYGGQLLALVLNIVILTLLVLGLKRIRHKIPFWV